MTREEIDRYTILRSVVGSHALGLNIETSDEDRMGVAIEPLARAVGLHTFEQYVSKEPDITIYSLRKFVSLALNGNPNVLNLLYTKPELCIAPAGQLIELRDKIISKRVAGPFRGYLKSQADRLRGIRGSNGSHGPWRPDLVAAHGYDTKFAMHALRLGYQGVQLLGTGKLTLPLQEDLRQHLLKIRHGGVRFEHVLGELEAVEDCLESTALSSPLPNHPDEKAVEAWMLETYFHTWSAREMNVRYVPEGHGFTTVRTLRDYGEQ